MYDPGAVAYGELLFWIIAIGGVCVWLVSLIRKPTQRQTPPPAPRTTPQARPPSGTWTGTPIGPLTYGPPGPPTDDQADPEIARLEPHWHTLDQIEAAELRAQIAAYDAGEAPRLNITALRERLARAESTDPAKYEHYRDNIRRGLAWNDPRRAHTFTADHRTRPPHRRPVAHQPGQHGP